VDHYHTVMDKNNWWIVFCSDLLPTSQPSSMSVSLTKALYVSYKFTIWYVWKNKKIGNNVNKFFQFSALIFHHYRPTSEWVYWLLPMSVSYFWITPCMLSYNFLKSSWINSHVSSLKTTDISGTISVPIIRVMMYPWNIGGF
jgi:hypothetical protein